MESQGRDNKSLLGGNGDEYCGHPEIYPTQWNQPRPEAAKMIKCACGKNASCPVCGWGRGCHPCDCTPKRPIDFDSAKWQGGNTGLLISGGSGGYMEMVGHGEK